MRKLLTAVALSVGFCSQVAAAPGDCMNTDPEGWKTNAEQKALYDKLVQYMSCPTDDPASGLLADKVACNYFVGKVLAEIYGINDFSTGAGTWLLANQMLDYVASHTETWSKLGKANSQAVLNDAAQGAGNQQPVLALMPGDPGHVAIILPGSPKVSSAWKLKAPNSAAFSLGHVENAYVFCRLSFAFSDPSQVDIYWRLK
ncbi:hypothetical protein MOV76_02400 [Rhizobium sp. PRIMUS64]|uniref:hypothetical protein n=1 Tax=Rhizobium TaxID=379 RepID=UPI0010311682|nr:MULTISPECIES: hypothetical protein [Rhizobium]MCJ9690502.1 hypothetical protein [Rhizobium sp. PRIMUS64]TBG96083.1 hypothetical protein ELG68_36120 [Rhizobium leguminosarum]